MFKKESLPRNKPPVKPLKEIRMKVLPQGFDSRRPGHPSDERASGALIVGIPPEVAQLLAESAIRRDIGSLNREQTPAGSDSPEVPNERLHTPRVD